MSGQAQLFGVFTGIPAVLGASCFLAPTSRGPFGAGGGTAVASQRLPADSIGTAVVAFAGVHSDSEIRVYLPDGTEVAGVESCAADQVLLWPVFATGSPNNTVRVVVMHMAYRLKEFSFTTAPGSQTLPIQQDRDAWYSNP